MNRSIAELIEALTEKRNALENLHSVLREETGLISRLDSVGLHDNSSRKGLICEKISELNAVCRSALVRANEENGASAGSGLSALIKVLENPERETLRTLRKSVIGIAEKNERLLDINKDLLENSLGLFDRSIRFFANFLAAGGTYGEAGRMTEAPVGARLVRKEM